MKKSKVLIFTIAVLLAGMGMSPLYAQSKNIKMAYVDLSRVFDEYVKTKEYDKMLEAKNTEYQTQRTAKVDKLKESQNKLSLLKEEEKKKLQEEASKQEAELFEFDRQKQTDLRKERDERIREILLEIEKVVKDFAEKEGYTLILNDRVLIYGNQELNITEKVIKLLNDSYPPK